MPSSFHTSCVVQDKTEPVVTDLWRIRQSSRTAILFSGGWDSLYCLIEAERRIEQPDLLFFDYGQSYLEREMIAVQSMEKEGLKRLKYIKYPPIPTQDGKLGIFDNRNGRFLEAAAAIGYQRVYFGSRNLIPLFDKYGDSNRMWAKRQGLELGIEVPTPATLVLKRQIIKACKRVFPAYSQHVFSTEGLS